MNKSVIEIIYEWIIKKQAEKLPEARDPHVVYVTDLIACTNKFHMRKKFPELAVTIEPSSVLGDIAHLGLGKLLSERGYEVEVEVSKTLSINNESFILKGRVDALNRAEGVVVEIKTSRAAIDIPKEHHIKQLKIYLEMLGLKTGILIYLTPDKMVEYRVEYEPVDLEWEVRTVLSNNKHPRYSWECKYCVYRKICPYYQPPRQSD